MSKALTVLSEITDHDSPRVGGKATNLAISNTKTDELAQEEIYNYMYVDVQGTFLTFTDIKRPVDKSQRYTEEDKQSKCTTTEGRFLADDSYNWNKYNASQAKKTLTKVKASAKNSADSIKKLDAAYQSLKTEGRLQ